MTVTGNDINVNENAPIVELKRWTKLKAVVLTSEIIFHI